jgi:hypothetical protein
MNQNNTATEQYQDSFVQENVIEYGLDWIAVLIMISIFILDKTSSALGSLFKKKKKISDCFIDDVIRSEQLEDHLDKKFEVKIEPFESKMNILEQHFKIIVENTSISKEELIEIKTNMKWVLEEIRQMRAK